MSWEPKYKELKELALDIARDYRSFINDGLSSYETVERLSVKYDKAVKSIYRYLNYAGVELKGRSEKRKVAIDKE